MEEKLLQHKVWLARVLATVMWLGAACVVVGWTVALTARCEGFGCIGKGVLIFATIVVELVAVAAGAALIWLRSLQGSAPGGLYAMVVVLGLPLLWFLLRSVLLP